MSLLALPARLWKAWVHRVTEPVDNRPLALLRIAACLCVVVDLVRVGTLGLVPHLFRLHADGGLSRSADSGWVLGSVLGPAAGPVAYGVTLGAVTLMMLGIGGRPVALLAVLAYAQLGHLYAPGDRAVDRALRTVLLIQAAAPGLHRLALGPLWRAARPAVPTTMPAWPEWLVRWLLVLMYLSAGTAKLIEQPDWLATSGTPVLYRIVADPMAGTVDPVAAAAWPWVWRIGGWFTIVLELSSPLLLTRYRHLWAVGGILMHIGVALTMDLGMFSWGMLSMYLVVVSPWVVRVLDWWGIGVRPSSGS